MFPFYLEYTRLGGEKRAISLKVEDLTAADLELVLRDVRANASLIYQEVYDEFSSVLDRSRNLQPAWREEAREQMRRVQSDLVAELEQKSASAPDRSEEHTSEL